MAAEETDNKNTEQSTDDNTVQDSPAEDSNQESTSEKKAEEETTAPETSAQENVTSFSLLDTEKPTDTVEKSTETKKPATPKQSDQVSPKTESILEKEQSKNISSEEVKDWLKDVRPDTTKEQEKGGGRPIFKWLAVLMILLLIAGAVAGGVYYYRQNVTPVEETEETQEPEESEQQEQEQEEEPTPTPEEVDLSIFSVNVLNGSGVAGEAGSVADMLSEAGFSNPNAANADSQDFTNTTVEHKETVPQSVVDEIESALEDTYTVEVSEETLEEEAEYDIVVTVGERSESEE